MDARIGKMTVDVWFYLPIGEVQAQCDDEHAGRIVLGDISEATALAGLLTGGTPVIGMEIMTDGAEASAEEIAAFEERARKAMEPEEVAV